MLAVDSMKVKAKVWRLLQLLSYTKRSLSLGEVLCALSITPEPINAPLPRLEDKRLLEFCKPLVETSSAGSVDFIHFSALE